MHASASRITTALALILLFTGTPARAEKSRLPELIRQTMPGVVTVVSYKPDLAMPAIGTGFFIAPDRVVTARHVLAGADRARVRTADGKSIGVAGIVAEMRDVDLAVVELDKLVQGATPLKIAGDSPDVGESLFAISSPLGFEFTASSGIVSAYREIEGAGKSMQHTVPISAGSSGCAILNDNGEVVAVQTGMITSGGHLVQAGQGLNFAVPARLIPKMKQGKLQKLADAAIDIRNDWMAPITGRMTTTSLYALTRDDFKAAFKFFEQGTKETPDEPDAWFRLGLCYERMGEKAKAVEPYKKAISLNPTFATALNNLGSVYTSLGDYEQAVAVLRKAIAAKKEYGMAQANLAFALAEKKDWPAALVAAKEAVRLVPKDAEAHLTLGRAAVRTGDRQEAVRQLDELQKLDKPKAERLKQLMNEKAK